VTTSGSNRTGRALAQTEAIALAYDPRDRAPRVTARGRGRLAKRIIETAKQHDVPVVSDQVTLEALRFVEVGDEIPPRVYRMVAQILAFVYNLGERPRDP